MQEKKWSMILATLAIGALLVTIACYPPLPSGFEKLRACLKTEKYCLFVASVATKNIPENSYATYIEGLKKFDYNFHIVGKELEWKGWVTRGEAMKSVITQLEQYFVSDELARIIVATSDTGDVLVQRGPGEILQKYENKTLVIKTKFPQLKSDDLVIVGGEWYCGGNCESTIYKWYDKLNIPQAERIFPYAQGGFAMGPVLAMKRFYSYTVDFMNTVKNDDQIAMANFALKYPEHIYIDYHQEIAATIIEFSAGDVDPPATGLNYDWNKAYEFLPLGLALSKEVQQRIGSNERIYPAFLHLPNNTRRQSAMDYWEKLVNHIRATAWK